MRRFVPCLLLALSSLCIPSVAASAPGNVQLQLELEPPQLKRGGQNDLIVWAEIEPGWHINGNKPADTFLVATEVSFQTPPGVSIESVTYPRPDRRSFAFAPGKELLVYEGKVGIATVIGVTADLKDREVNVVARLRYQSCNDTTCRPPATATAELTVPVLAQDVAARNQGDSAPPSASSGSGTELGDWLETHSLPVTLLLVTLLGLGLNLTPCVYPLISVTVAFFGRQGHHHPRRVAWLASLYVAGITVSFAAVGVAAASSGGVFGSLLQKPPVLLAISTLMVGLALSSFGLYQLRPPAWLMYRISSSGGGAAGALFMGLTMGIVAAPCVGPVVLGLLLFVGARQDVLLGFALFSALGLGMGFPYLGLALAAGSIKALPRSGEWLVWVEHVFGFLLLGMAVHFLTPLLPAPAKAYALPGLLAVAAIYLGFVDRSGLQQPSFGRLKKGIGTIALVLALWSAWPPAAQSAIEWQPFDPDSLARARQAGRPALVDFVADWCIPCHEMDAKTYTDAGVQQQANRFAMFKADITRESEEMTVLTDSFSVRGVPTVILFDSKGNEVTRLVGFTAADEMLDAMRKVE